MTVKKSLAETAANNNDTQLSLVQDMPIATALLVEDTESLASMIENSLPKSGVQVEEVRIQKTVGEAFTGGRSTPIYRVSCMVVRPNKTRLHRHFVAKVVLMPCDATSAGATTNSSSIPHKLWVKRESYAVERRFYDCAAPRVRAYQPLMGEGGGGLTIPKLLASDRDGSKPWPAVCFFMNDLSTVGYPLHPDFLSTAQTKAALRWIATFHCLFWAESLDQDTSSGSTWKRDLWSRGGHWTAMIPSGEKKTEINVSGLGQQWSQTVRWLESKHPSVITAETKGIGKRLEAAAPSIAGFLSAQSTKGSIGTLIHGDYKAANMFFAEDNWDDDDDNQGADRVAVLDFQFSGMGVGAEDVAYLLFPDARGDYFDSEKELLECYHEELIAQLMVQSKGGPSSLSFESFTALFELSRLDLLRHLLGRGWVGSTVGDARLVSAIQITMHRLDGGNPLSSRDEYNKALADFVGLG